jgi:hypothetical protein
MIWLGISIGMVAGVAITSGLLWWAGVLAERDFRADMRGRHDI